MFQIFRKMGGGYKIELVEIPEISIKCVGVGVHNSLGGGGGSIKSDAYINVFCTGNFLFHPRTLS